MPSTPDTTFNMSHLISAPFVRCGINLNSIPNVVTLVARNANEAMMTPIVESGGICVYRECEIWRQAVGFVFVCLLLGKKMSVAVKMFSHLIQLIRNVKNFALSMRFPTIIQQYTVLLCNTQKFYFR
jgi:hypothetical protein